jgi:hypothetical protein
VTKKNNEIKMMMYNGLTSRVKISGGGQYMRSIHQAKVWMRRKKNPNGGDHHPSTCYAMM